MRVEVRTQIRLRRLAHDRKVVTHERHLLREAPAHDHIVAVETEAHGFAREHFLIDALLDQSAQLCSRRLALGLRFPERSELRDLTGSNADLAVILLLLPPRGERKQQRADQQEMQQRLADGCAQDVQGRAPVLAGAYPGFLWNSANNRSQCRSAPAF